MTKLICIVCPKGCHLSVDEQNDYAVTGNECQRGAVYGKKEQTNPTRVVTSTVRIANAPLPRLPVKTLCDIPKEHIREAMLLLNCICMQAPVKMGDVVVDDSKSTGAVFVATRNMEKV